MLFVHSRVLFPEGLPPSYVFVATVRVKSPAHQMKFDLWRILSQEGLRQVAVTLNGVEKSVTFTSTSVLQKEQSVIFNHGSIKVGEIKLWYGMVPLDLVGYTR